MSALSTTQSYRTSTHALPGASSSRPAARLGEDMQTLLSIFVRTLFMLGLGSLAMLTLTGMMPLFFIPLALFLLCGSVLDWQTRGGDRLLAASGGRHGGNSPRSVV